MQIVRELARALRHIIGAPDYASYLAHMRTHHPNVEPLSPADFERERLTARYDRPGARCC